MSSGTSQGQSVYNKSVYILILAMILTGASNTLVYKYQNTTQIDGITFFHPYMQAVTMFFGEAICYTFFLFQIKRQPEDYEERLQKAQDQGLKTKMNPIWLLIPASCDFIASTLQYIALNFISGSVYQMLRGAVIVIVALFSKFFLKKQIKKNQIFGCFLAISGITIVGTSSILYSDSSNSTSSSSMQLFSFALIILSLIFNGVLFISEEKLFSIYYLEPFQVVGTEGIWGIIIYIVLLPILSFTHCPSSFAENGACVVDGGTDYFERPNIFFQQMGSDGVLFFFIILGILTIAAFNVTGVTVTKKVSSLARSVVDVTRTLLVWIVGLIVTASSNRKWEITKWQAIIIEALGFIILISGNMIYNEIIKLPFLKSVEDGDTTDTEVFIQKPKNRKGNQFKSDASERSRQ